VKWVALVGIVLTAGLALAACGKGRRGGDLHVRHAVIVATDEGKREFSSVLNLAGYQYYHFGSTSGYGAVSCRLTGDAVRIPLGDRIFYLLLGSRADSTPAWRQCGLVKKYFGIPNASEDGSWVEMWRTLASSDRSAELLVEDYPPIAVVAKSGWMDDARMVSREEAEELGLRILSYRLKVTRDPVGASHPGPIRYKPQQGRRPKDFVHQMYIRQEDGPS
jgi:hypothetical protein